MNKIKRIIKQLFSTRLPEALRMLQIKRIAAAAAFFLLAVTLAVIYKGIKPLALSLVSLWLIYLIIELRVSFMNGKIIEKVVICHSVKTRSVGNRTRILFETQEDNPSYYDYTLSGKRYHDLISGSVYLIYYATDNPESLLAYKEF